MLELQPVQKKDGDPTLTLPDSHVLEDLGQRALAVAMRHWRRVKDRCKELTAHVAFGIDRRAVESYSLPCAMLGAIRGLSTDENRDLMWQVLEGRDIKVLQQSDEERLLREIWESTVHVERGKTETVSELLKDGYFDYVAAVPALEKVGIKKLRAYGSKPERIFLVQEPIKRVLLKDSDFKWLEIDQILARVKGASRIKQQIGSQWPPGIAIPVASIEELIGKNEPAEDEPVV